MKKFLSHFEFNKREQSGIFFLLALIVVLQLGFFFLKKQPIQTEEANLVLNHEVQKQVDSLKIVATSKADSPLRPFNPNYINDYKGYTLGMTSQEIDRLLRFRKKDRFVNSAAGFQKVTQISDSLLGQMAPLFKFPEWTQTAKKERASQNNKDNTRPLSIAHAPILKDINKATTEELRIINGIGEKLSARIIKFRDRLGGFLIDTQLYDVYGLDKEVADRALQRFKVLSKPMVSKININSATVPEMAALVYINYDLANKIESFRESKGGIKSFDELKEVEGFPSEKLDRIILYLSL